MSPSSAHLPPNAVDRGVRGSQACDHPDVYLDRRRARDRLLHVLTPTDSCRDRLAGFLAWNDFSGLEQALGVCRARGDVDLDLVRDWCARMGQRKKWELFAARLG